MRNKGTFRRIRDIKQQTTPEELFPPNVCTEFHNYLHYCRMIPFEALPDYEFLKNLFLHVIITCEEQEEIIVEEFDWIVKRQNLIERSALGVGVDLSLMGNAREREFSPNCD